MVLNVKGLLYELNKVIRVYPQGSIALFILGCAITFFALSWKW